MFLSFLILQNPSFQNLNTYIKLSYQSSIPDQNPTSKNRFCTHLSKPRAEKDFNKKKKTQIKIHIKDQNFQQSEQVSSKKKTIKKRGKLQKKLQKFHAYKDRNSKIKQNPDRKNRP